MVIHWKLTTFWLLFLLNIFHSTDSTSPVENISLCPNITRCPYSAKNCSSNDDCSPGTICCESQCGRICIKQLLSGCQTLRLAESRRAKALGVDKRDVRIPRCNKEGGFETIQCDNEITSSCWCVDEAGFEKPGTRAPAAALVNCTAPKLCADHTCRMFCPHGFALTEEGCPLCKCRDPCDNIKCPHSLECRAEELACSDPPCPPIPSCKRGRSLQNICPLGDPLRISDTVRPFLCGTDPGKPSCPPLYQCLVQKGNDYGVCCPASLQIKKTGECPARSHVSLCGTSCHHDLECPSMQKCCDTDNCGSMCTNPTNVTECLHQKAFSEILSLNERMGRGYIPQCTKDGEFESKQCSRNGLVCWCVNSMGLKITGTMGPSSEVSCSTIDNSIARSLLKIEGCTAQECAAVCEYGYQLDENGCPTCICDDPCNGYKCADDEECTNVKDVSCTEFLCPSIPVCHTKTVYNNPCVVGTPLTDDISGNPISCDLQDNETNSCPNTFQCVSVRGSNKALCCLEADTIEADATDQVESIAENRPQTMCEYLHEFSESMEGTQEGMTLAIPSPNCTFDGDYSAVQCHKGACWCVDYFGTEIPNTLYKNHSLESCTQLRVEMGCLGLTCRMGCEYGFTLAEDSGCPQCQCRDPCSNVLCEKGDQCQMVDVSCKDQYCPPVPACLPKKSGQCPYLMPTSSNSCDFECNTDLSCNGTAKCCSNGCGTQCIEPLQLTKCQHARIVIQYQAHEAGIPANKIYIPNCSEDGSYSEKQCNSLECWCTDGNGFEIEQSRSAYPGKTDCESVRNECPMLKCRENCEHGYELNENGCRTCKCVDPCATVSCRGEGETCRLVPVECVASPCPPVPMCLPKKENPCNYGSPLANGGETTMCGPDFGPCPSSHKCQLSPIGEYAVCCPKPRDVCFESMEHGYCSEDKQFLNTTRYFFNPKTNKCQKFVYSGCGGNHNNFHTDKVCMSVCPVLSQCERLREKNLRAAKRYNKSTFIPKCEEHSGAWKAIQCLEHVGVCWCVNPHGEPLKGTLTRGGEPECNFRQARNRAMARSDTEEAPETNFLLQELMTLIGSMQEIENVESSSVVFTVDGEKQSDRGGETRCLQLGGQCDGAGKFLPTQCEDNTCWCVDEAGNQLPQTNTFSEGNGDCRFTPIDTVEVTLGFRGDYDSITAIPITKQINRIVTTLKGTINSDGVRTEINSDALYAKFTLTGSNKVDVAFIIEQMVLHNRLPGLSADITRSRVIHKLQTSEVESVDVLEQREIVSQSPVSVVAPYHTALIVIAAASAFVISILTLLVILYKRKTSHLYLKQSIDQSQFLNSSRPIYIELPKDSYKPLSE